MKGYGKYQCGDIWLVVPTNEKHALEVLELEQEPFKEAVVACPADIAK